MAFVRLTEEMATRAIRDTDWARVDATTDEGIARQIAEDPDTAPDLSDAELVAAMAISTRHRLGLSQQAFSARYGIPMETLLEWERGEKQPETTAFSYLRVIASAPDIVERALHPAAA